MASFAIDFGSTNTPAGIYSAEYKKVIYLKAEGISVVYDNIPVIPSVYSRNGYIGLKAVNASGKSDSVMKRFLNTLRNFLFRFKSEDYLQTALNRNIYYDIKKNLYKTGSSNEYKKVLHLFLSELKKLIEKKEIRIDKMLFSYPVIRSGKQGEHYQKILKQVAERVFEKIPVEFADEIVCSAVGYGLNLNETQQLCITDMGGSTTSFSLCELRKDRNISTVIARESYDFGGRDIDEMIAGAMQTDLNISEKIKIALSEQKEYEHEGIFYSRSDFENLLSKAGVFERIEISVEKLKNRALDKGLNINQISRLIFVGGTTKIPCIKQAVQNQFPGILSESDSVFDAVAKGGAYLSAGIRFDPHLNYYYGLKTADHNESDYKIFLWKGDSIFKDNGEPSQIRLLVKNLWGKYQLEMGIEIYEFEGEDVEQYFRENVMDYKVMNDDSKRLTGNLIISADKAENMLCFSFNEQKELFVSKNEEEKQKIGAVR